MRMKMKKIKFKSRFSNFIIPPPAPASRSIPEWYREMVRVSNGTETVKTCVPFLDAMMSGYTVYLAADVYFENGKVSQISEIPMVEKHSSEQMSAQAVPSSYEKTPYKWVNNFFIETPNGYSCFITHPVNRMDLPFYTLSGVVETDNFPAPINFPFFIKKDFTGVIMEGTPLAQIIPFKRTDWVSEVDDTKDTNIPVSFLNKAFNPPFGYYKKNFWKRKKYD